MRTFGPFGDRQMAGGVQIWQVCVELEEKKLTRSKYTHMALQTPLTTPSTIPIPYTGVTTPATGGVMVAI